MNKTLFFVYNAKSDVLNKYWDIAHKIISPNTYSCSLCSLTHGSFSEKKDWKNFRENATQEFVFMYKNEFLKAYPDAVMFNFPVVLQKEEKKFKLLIDSEKLASITSIKDVIELVKNKIS